jgi:hypothetical protein
MSEDVLSPQPDQNAAPDSSDDILASLVGPDKKFKTVADLAKGKLQADSHISQIERENADLRKALETYEEQLKKQRTLEELLEAMKSSKATDGNPQSLDLDTVTQLVRNVTKEEREAATREANRAKVNAAILETAGGDAAKARALVAQRAKELGLTTEYFRNLSETSPQAALALINASTKSGTSTSIKPDVNTEAVRQPLRDSDPKPNSYYMELRRKMGTAKFYADYNLVRRMYADADKLGDAFLDT